MFEKIWKGIVAVAVFVIGILVFFLIPDRDDKIDEQIKENDEKIKALEDDVQDAEDKKDAAKVNIKDLEDDVKGIREKKKDIEKKKVDLKEKKKNIEVEEEDPVKFLRDFANSDNDAQGG